MKYRVTNSLARLYRETHTYIVYMDYNSRKIGYRSMFFHFTYILFEIVLKAI